MTRAAWISHIARAAPTAVAWGVVFGFLVVCSVLLVRACWFEVRWRMSRRHQIIAVRTERPTPVKCAA